jgi:hypothetical protein
VKELVGRKEQRNMGEMDRYKVSEGKAVSCNSPAASDTSKSRSRASLCDKVKAAVSLGALPGAEASP